MPRPVNNAERIGQTIHGFKVLKAVRVKGLGHKYECECLKCGRIKLHKWYNLTRLLQDYCPECSPRQSLGMKKPKKQEPTRVADWADVMRGWILR